MNKRPLGKTGREITEVGFGAWGIGSRHYGPVEEGDAIEALEAYLGGGGNFIDTARGYNFSERIIGQFLADRGLRDQVVLASKIWANDPEAAQRDFDESRKQLQVDCIDLLYLHNPPDEPDEMNRLLDLYSTWKDRGQIRGIGASIKGADVTQATSDLCRQYIATGRVDALQVIYSIFRQKTKQVFAEAEAAGVAIVARTVLESGFLTGKYRPGHKFAEGFPDGDHRSRWNGERLDAILNEADAVADLAVKPPFENISQVAMRFALDTPGVTAIIPGAKNRKQAEANVAVAALGGLPGEVYQRLASAYADRESLINLG